jgi:hypothetical protein
MPARLDRTHSLCTKVSAVGRVSSSRTVTMRTHELAKRLRSVTIASMDVPLRQMGMPQLDDLILSSTYN